MSAILPSSGADSPVWRNFTGYIQFHGFFSAILKSFIPETHPLC
ncbi:hypothetical protein RBY4I_2852 [Rhodobacterales bacterium Y4I]|nr:hypothetical protein RBY4I_2852 [Rhodobacterales bacterium Y4I]